MVFHRAVKTDASESPEGLWMLMASLVVMYATVAMAAAIGCGWGSSVCAGMHVGWPCTEWLFDFGGKGGRQC
jgi:hypothetical protein